MAKINLNAPIKQSWASELQSLGRRNRDREELTSNRESQALAAIAALEDQGEVLSDAQKVDILNQYVSTGDFTLRDTPQEDFSGVTGGAVVIPQAPAQQDTPGFIGRRLNEAGAVVDALQAGAYRDSAAVLSRMGRSASPVFSGPARQIGAVVDALTSPVLPQDGGIEVSEIINRFSPSEEALAAGLAKLRGAADSNMSQSNRVLAPLIEEGGVRGLAARTFQDAAQSGASSAVSLVGGPLAAVSAGGITYANSYEDAIAKGLTPAEAEEYAIGQGVIEGGVSFIPAERLVSRIPGVRQGLQRLTGEGVRSLDNMIASPAIATAARTAATVVGEGVSEASTEFAQSLAAAAQAGMAEDQRQRSFLTQAADLENLGENVTRAGLAGALMGGTISAPINTVQERQRYNERVQQTRDNTAQNIRDSFNEQQAQPVLPAEPGTTQPTTYGLDVPNVDRELFNAQQDAQRQAEIDRAFEQRETEERLQREVEEEAGFRTMEAQRADGTMASQLRGVIDTTVTPEDVAAERLLEIERTRREQRQEQATQERANVQQQLARIQQRRDTVTTQAQRDAAKAATAERRNVTALENTAIDSMVVANPNITNEQIRTQLPTEVARLRAEQEAAARNKSRAPRNKKNTKKRTTPAPVSQLETSTDPDDQRAAAVMKLIGDTLGMSAPQTASTNVPADFTSKVDRIADALARDSGREAAAVEQLIADRRLIVAPNAASIGRNDAGLAAAYDTGTGTMYVYTDNMGDNVLADIMTAVPHEGTHVGQGQGREGRSQAMQALLGSEGPALLRQLAAQGHAGAKAALKRARDDTKARRDRGEENPERYEDVELAAYFVGDLRGRSPGRARAAINSMVASARNVMRERLGVDLNINATDLEAAARRVVEEAAVTPRLTRNTLNPETLGMIYNQNSRGFDEALANGYIYDSVDGRRKYVLSDEDALIRGEMANTVAQSNEPIRMGDVLQHEVLYREHPEAADIPVYAADNLGDDTTFAFYDPNAKEIWVRRDVANGTNSNPSAPTFKGALMHELQHYVQDEGGYSDQYFDGEAAAQSVQGVEEALAQADAALATEARSFLDNILRAIPAQQDKNLVMRDIMRPASNDLEMASRVRDTVQGMENVTPEAQQLINNYEAARGERNVAARQLTAARNEQHNNYLRNITEREAHFTQYQTQASQMGMPDNSTGINPEPAMRQQEADPDTGIDPTQGMIDVPVDTPEGRQVQARSEAAPDTLGMAATPTQNNQSTPIRNRRGGTTLVSLLRNDKGLGKAVRDAVELASPFVAPIEARSNQYVGEYQNALNRMAVQQGKTYAELNNEIRDALAEIQELDGGPSEYKAAFNAVASRYGDAGVALRQLRNLNDELSRSIIDTYLNRGGKLTKAEAQELESVVNNLGRYTHRFYASRVPGDAGKSYRDSVWNTIQKHKKGKKLTPKEKEVYDTYTAAAKTLLEDMYIPDAEGLNKLKQERIDYLYGTWITNKEMGATRDDKIAALEQKREQITPEEMERQLEITSKALLYPFDDTSPVSTFYNRGAKRDNTIMKKRQQIPKEIRDFMGEITDPMGALMVTASKQAEWVARTNMFLELQRVADPNDLQPPGQARSVEVERNNMTELKGSEFGPMEGWYASPAMRAMIDSTRESLMTLTDALTTGQQYETIPAKIMSNAGQIWSKAASTAKYTSVVFNIVRMGYNAAGSAVMPAFNGNFNPATYVRGLQDAANLIRYSVNPSLGLRSAEDAVRFRVVDSATVGDLKSLDRPFLNELVRDLSGKDSKGFIRALGKYVSAGRMGLREAYAMADVWAKIANFHNEVDYLTKLYRDAGITKTENEIKREASTIVNDTNIGWLRTAPVVKALERGGITMFGAYMYDTFRVQITNMLQGAADIRRAADMPNAKSKARAAAKGMSRLGGQAGYLAMWYALSQSLAGIFGDDEDKKREVGLYDGMQYDDYVNVGIGEDGKARLFRFSDFDPLGPSVNLMRAARAGGEWEDVGKALLGAYIAPSIAGVGTTAVLQTAANVSDGEDEYVRTPVTEEWFANNFYNKMLDTAEGLGVKPNTVRAWNSVGETILLPGTMRAWTKSNLTPLTPASPETFDTLASNLYSGMRYAGARASTYDPKIGGRAAREAYTVAVSNARKGMADYVRRTNDPTPEELLGKATEYVRQEKEAWDKVNRMYEGMLALGMDEEQITEALGDGFPSMPAATLNQVRRGEFTSTLFDKSSFQQRAKSSIDRARTEREKAELTERWENAWEILQLYKGDY